MLCFFTSNSNVPRPKSQPYWSWWDFSCWLQWSQDFTQGMAHAMFPLCCLASGLALLLHPLLSCHQSRGHKVHAHDLPHQLSALLQCSSVSSPHFPITFLPSEVSYKIPLPHFCPPLHSQLLCPMAICARTGMVLSSPGAMCSPPPCSRALPFDPLRYLVPSRPMPQAAG